MKRDLVFVLVVHADSAETMQVSQLMPEIRRAQDTA